MSSFVLPEALLSIFLCLLISLHKPPVCMYFFFNLSFTIWNVDHSNFYVLHGVMCHRMLCECSSDGLDCAVLTLV